MHLADFSPPQSRPAIKKYILANNKTAAASTAVFDTQFNKAIRTGVDKGDFEQPKGIFHLSILLFFSVSFSRNHQSYLCKFLQF